MHFRNTFLSLLLGLGAGMAGASGLQVAPTSLTLPPTQAADGLWLSNTGGNVVQAQVRVYRWTQENGEDRLTPSRDLLVSPPMLQVATADRQLIRVIRTRPPTAPMEEAYRVVIDELPVASEGRKNIEFVLSYSVPVFIAPAGTSATPGAAPQLAWTTLRQGGQTLLQVSNSGGTHAQLADLHFVDAAGKRTELHPGLLGYVLPGAQMRWPLKTSNAALEAGGTLEALINGQTARHSLAPDARPR